MSCEQKPTWRHWAALALAIVLEVLGTTVMKMSHGWAFSHASMLGLVAMWLCVALSYYCLSLSTTALPVGVAFACWEAAGLTLITLSSVLVVGEMMSVQRFLGLCCVLGGALLVHMGTGSGHNSEKSDAPQVTPTSLTSATPEGAQRGGKTTACKPAAAQEEGHA